MVEYQKPSIVFESENIRGVSFFTPHLFSCGGGDVLEACDPGDRSLYLNGYFRDIDSHECGVPENLFPTRANVFPSRQAAPARMDANRAGVGRPDFIHEVDIETLESEIELEIRFDNLFGVSHGERLCITETKDKLASDSIGKEQP